MDKLRQPQRLPPSVAMRKRYMAGRGFVDTGVGRSVARRSLFSFAHLVFIVLGFIGWGGKIGVSSWLSFRIHFTNWTWALNTVFYTLAMLGYLMPDVDLVVNVLGFVAVWAATVVVFVGAIALLYLNPGIVTSASVSTGLALVLDRTFHVLPLVWNMIYLLARKNELRLMYHMAGGWATRLWGNCWPGWDAYVSTQFKVQRAAGVSHDDIVLPLPLWWMVLHLVVLPLFYPVIYASTTNYKAAYDIDMPLWLVLSAIIVLGVASAMLVMSMMYERHAFRAALWWIDALVLLTLNESYVYH